MASSGTTPLHRSIFRWNWTKGISLLQSRGGMLVTRRSTRDISISFICPTVMLTRQERCFSSENSLSESNVTDQIDNEDDDNSNETEQKEMRVAIIQAVSSSSLSDPDEYRTMELDKKTHQRVWFPNSAIEPHYWKEDVIQCSHKNPHILVSLLDRIEKQEVEGGRMRSKQCGVLHEDPSVDMRLLVENYTVNSLASALRDREEMLQVASQLAAENKFEALQDFLKDCHPNVVLERRRKLRRLDLEKPLDFGSLESIRKGLMRMPRRVTTAHSKRAGVVIPLVHVDGVPSVLLEKRAAHLRAHPDEVCLPGGMVCEMSDRSIVETCLREMKEEIGGFDFEYHHQTTGSQGVSVLGILRCNWGEVHHLVGLAVTPVVCFFYRDLAEVDLKPNPDEVAEVFTIPLHSLLDKQQWVYKDDHAPIFVGGPYVIWGLTGYILERFYKDILLPFHSKSGEDHHR
ncbi:NUDIX family hydrolase [Nitzschia inconspicua]|uniref:NUDIX family hydrolase n=1 Tax=Nitzschia inconspicua TaxID=303405 RepID=A0A9K3LRL3_9STRA|nr:NUDIX family hydrolase [Nitzschia inconspicua]